MRSSGCFNLFGSNLRGSQVSFGHVDKIVGNKIGSGASYSHATEFLSHPLCFWIFDFCRHEHFPRKPKRRFNFLTKLLPVGPRLVPPSKGKITQRKPSMKRTTKTMMAGAAVAGLFSGAFAAQAHASQTTSDRSSTSFVNAGSMAVNLADSDSGKHDCKGKNGCKGQGGCKAERQWLQGQELLQGQGRLQYQQAGLDLIAPPSDLSRSRHGRLRFHSQLAFIL